MSSFFPISLNTQSGQDPFSRTVSPIGHRSAIPAPASGLSNITTAAGPGNDMNVDMDTAMNDHTMSISSSITPPVNIVDFAYHNLNSEQHAQVQVYHSAPTSPRGTRLDTGHDMLLGRASSAEPPISSTFFSFPSDQYQSTRQSTSGLVTGMNPDTSRPLAMSVTQNQIDHNLNSKPSLSLLTLINSRPHTPLTHSNHPQAQADRGGQESPTLFNGDGIGNTQDLNHEHGLFDVTRRMSFVGSKSMSMGMGMSVPNAGGVGRLSLSKGSEGLGLGLGLEMELDHAG